MTPAKCTSNVQDCFYSSAFVEQPWIAEKTYATYSVGIDISFYTTIVSETQTMKAGEMAGASPDVLPSAEFDVFSSLMMTELSSKEATVDNMYVKAANQSRRLYIA